MALWKTIPGETPIDPSGLKIKGITKREQLNSFEAENIRKAAVKYLARKPNRRSARFDLSWAMRLHREMFGDVWEWAGSFRKEDKSIGSPWYQVESSLQALLDDLACWEQHDVDILEQAVMLHHRAVHITRLKTGMAGGHACWRTSGSECMDTRQRLGRRSSLAHKAQSETNTSRPSRRPMTETSTR